MYAIGILVQNITQNNAEWKYNRQYNYTNYIPNELSADIPPHISGKLFLIKPP